MAEDFSQYPVSLAEVKGKDAHEWTARDVLISLLRKIDRNEVQPDALLVVYDEGPLTAVSYSVSSPGTSRTMGIIEMAKHVIMTSSYTKD
jgi:hypothetical protein